MATTQEAHDLGEAFGRVLADARRRRGLSQEALADASDLHRTYISQIERGLKSPSLKTMQRLADALDAQLWTLIRKAVDLGGR